jgi:hypothetical protein
MTAEERRSARAFIELFARVPRPLSSGDGEALTQSLFREAVFSELHAVPNPANRPLIVALLRREMSRRRGGGGDYDDLFCTAFLLALQRNLSDVPLLWEAKTMDFDAQIGLDVQLLVFCGIDPTVQFLLGRGDAESVAAASYIAECRITGDFDDMNSYVAARERYFGFTR